MHKYKKILKASYGYCLPLFCAGLLGAITFLACCPFCTDSAKAATITTYLPSTINLTMAAGLSASIEPTVDGVFKTMSTSVGVQVANSDYFTVSIKGDTNMTGTSENTKTIAPVSPNTPAASFTNNTWGYSWSKGNTAASVYHPVPAEYVKLDEQTVAEDGTAAEIYTLGFGAKVDTTLPADSYTGSVTIAVVSNPKTVVETTYEAFAGITTMQGMTAAACADAKFGETARLEDIRDGKKYWVTKLADGNCWMVQNLDLDLTTAGLSTSNGSNVDWYAGSDWEGTNNGDYPPVETQTTSVINSSAATNTNSWDQGEYAQGNPTIAIQCSGYSGTGTNPGNPQGVAGCTGSTSKTFVNVTGWTASDDPDFTNKSTYTLNGQTKTKDANKPVDTVNNVYDAHYLIGNYYSFNAATAGTGAAVTANGDNAAGDICPKGWELPLVGQKNNDGNSFYRMLVAQGMTGLADADNINTAVSQTAIVKTVSYNQDGYPIEGSTSMTINNALTTAPLFFIRGGYVYWQSKMYEIGFNGLYWSRSASSSTTGAGQLNIGATYVTSGNGSRYTGEYLRCLYHPAS